MSTGFFTGLAGRLRKPTAVKRRLQLSDINGMVLAVVALALTIVSTTLSEARFRAADADRARIEATAAAATTRVCDRGGQTASEARPKG